MIGLHELPYANGGCPGHYGFTVHEGSFPDGHLPGVEIRNGRTVRPVAGATLRHFVASSGRAIDTVWQCWPDGAPRYGGFVHGDVPSDPPRLEPFKGPLMAAERRPAPRNLTEQEAEQLRDLAAVVHGPTAAAHAAQQLLDNGVEPYETDEDYAAAKELWGELMGPEPGNVPEDEVPEEANEIMRRLAVTRMIRTAEAEDMSAHSLEDQVEAYRCAVELLESCGLTPLFEGTDEGDRARDELVEVTDGRDPDSEASDDEVIVMLRLTLGGAVRMYQRAKADVRAAEAAKLDEHNQKVADAKRAAAEAEAARQAKRKADQEQLLADRKKRTEADVDNFDEERPGDSWDKAEHHELRALAKALRDAGAEGMNKFWLDSTDALRERMRTHEPDAVAIAKATEHVIALGKELDAAVGENEPTPAQKTERAELTFVFDSLKALLVRIAESPEPRTVGEAIDAEERGEGEEPSEDLNDGDRPTPVPEGDDQG